jgi:Major capsid protein Gp23
MLPTRSIQQRGNPQRPMRQQQVQQRQPQRHLATGNAGLRSVSLTEEADPHRAAVLYESRRNQQVRKWAPVLNKTREVPKKKFGLMAAILENQYNAWDPKGRSMLFEDLTTTANIADFTRFALPLIRKSYPKLIADNLVGVQPMSQPASLIFYIRYRYALTKGQTIAGTQIMRQNTAASFARQNGWALDPFYSSQEVHGEDATVLAQNVVQATLAHRPVLAGTVVVEVYDNAASLNPQCETPVPCLRVSFDADGNPDTVLVGDCSDFTATLTVDTTTAGATVFNHSTGQVQVTLSAGHFPPAASAIVNYEFDLEANPFQPEVTLSIDSDSVAAVTRKLKTTWSLEAAQDLKSVHNIDAESTLTDLMADEMVAEIDREIINDLIISAAIRATHNFATAAGASVNFTDRNIALLYKVLEVANIIHRTTLRGPANWMVTSADIASKFEQLNDFRGSDALAMEGIDIGITNAGTIQGKLRLYKDPLFPNCKILLGFKGNSVLDAGYFYAPYIPLLSTPTVLDPNSFVPNKGIMTRYGKKLIEDGGLYYGVVTVSNL